MSGTLLSREDIAGEAGAVPALVGRPSTSARTGGIVLLEHAWGLDVFVEDRVRRLAERGYLVVAPDLFHRTNVEHADVIARIRSLQDEQIVSDVRSAVRFLEASDQPPVGSLGVVGFCMGGRAAYLSAARIDAFDVAVVFYGGNVGARIGGSVSPLELSEHISCPVYGFFGREDRNPSSKDVAAIRGELERLGKPCELFEYEGAGHAFLNFNDPPRYREEQATHAWGKCISLLDSTLRHDHTEALGDGAGAASRERALAARSGSSNQNGGCV